MDLVSQHHPGGERKGFWLFQNVQLVFNWGNNVDGWSFGTVLRGTFVCKRGELFTTYYWDDKSRRMGWVRHVADEEKE